jgi:hypothetical protein
MTWSLADAEQAANQLEREIYGITLNEQKGFKKAFSICLIEFQSWWVTISIQPLQNIFQQRVKHLRYPKMHRVSHIS